MKPSINKRAKIAHALILGALWPSTDVVRLCDRELAASICRELDKTMRDKSDDSHFSEMVKLRGHTRLDDTLRCACFLASLASQIARPS
jgi:hypothetical protein